MDRQIGRLLDQVDHAVFVIEPDAAGRPVYAAFNHFACRVLGCTEDDIIGLTAKEVYPGRLGAIAYDHHREVLRTGIPRSYEIQLPIQGSERLVRTSLRPMAESNCLIGSSTDITGYHIMRQMQANVATIHAEAEDFIALAAHDLRAPLRHVGAIADLLREDFVDMGDGKLALIDMLEALGTKAMALISDVLSHAEATSVTAESGPSHFDFGNLVRELMALLDPKGQCRCHIPEGQIIADRVVFQIVLRNLIDNAIKYAVRPENAEGVELSFSYEDAGDGQVEVTIEDNGRGFEDPAILFLNEGKLRSGSGFGLFGVRRLLRARGGSISAENVTDGQGARISFCIGGQVIHPPVSAGALRVVSGPGH